MEKPNFKKMCLMYIQQLTNFPYIEKDFDALTDYQLLCKVVEYLNKVITNNNIQNETVTNLYNAFVALKEYVDNYFDNLDVQDEINNKLDEMVEQGTLQEIISDYLNSKAVFGFDNVEGMKEATNLINGSYAKTLGYYAKNDGGSATYKIRTITNEDVVDDMFIIAIETSGDLIAELIYSSIINVKQLGYKTDGSDNYSKLYSTSTKLSGGSTLYFPKGIYTFKSPIVFNKRINIIGDEVSITDIDKNYGSCLYFKELPANSTAITLPGTKSLIKDIMVESDSYDLFDNRSLCAKGVDVFTETINVSGINGIGFSDVAFGTTLKNCRFRGFSENAINGSTFIIVENCSFWRTNVGVKIVSDCTINCLRLFHVKNGIKASGSNNLITNIRMDSVQETGITIQNHSNIVDNCNIDYCQYNAIKLHNCTDSIIKNIVSRCGTIYPYDSETDGNIVTFKPNSEYAQYLGIVLMSGYNNSGNSIEVPVSPRNPLDTDSNLRCSLFGVTTINTPYRNNYNCLIGKNYTIYDPVYVNNFDRAVYICNGNITGKIFFNGLILRILNNISDYGNLNFNNMELSQFSNPTQ